MFFPFFLPFFIDNTPLYRRGPRRAIETETIKTLKKIPLRTAEEFSSEVREFVKKAKLKGTEPSVIAGALQFMYEDTFFDVETKTKTIDYEY